MNTVDEVFILTEQEMSAHCQDEVAVVQTGPMQLSVDLFQSNTHHDLKCDIKIKGVYNTKVCAQYCILLTPYMHTV